MLFSREPSSGLMREAESGLYNPVHHDEILPFTGKFHSTLSSEIFMLPVFAAGTLHVRAYSQYQKFRLHVEGTLLSSCNLHTNVKNVVALY